MNRTRKTIAVAGATALVAVGIVGCSSKGSAHAGSKTNASGNGTKTTATQPSSKQGKPLVLSTGPKGTFTDNFNPFSATADDGTKGFIYEPLFYYNLVGSQVYPILGKSKSWSNNNKTLTVMLNAKAKWTDGKPFTAQDVVFTFDLLKKHPAADLGGVWAQLSGVKAEGEHKVVFNFKRQDVPFAMYVLQQVIVPKHLWGSVSKPTKFQNGKPIGTGPYTLEHFSSQEIKYKANASYYKGLPPVPKIMIPAYNSNTSNNLALSRGKIDWDGVFMPKVQKNFVAKDTKHNHYWFPPDAIVSLVPNLKGPLLSNLAVRKALSFGINRTEIQNKGESGYMKAAQPYGILPTMKNWVDPNLPAADKSSSYDPKKAVQILQKAGFKKNSSGIFVSPNGKPLSFNLLIVSGWTDWEADAQLITQSLKKIGIKINVRQVQYGAYMSKLQAHKFQLAFSSSNSGPNPYYIFESLLHSKNQYNYEQFSNSTVDNALDNFSKTTSKSQQKKDIYQVERILADKLPVIPMIYGIQGYEYSTQKYTGWPTSKNPYVTPAPWSWPAPEIVIMHLKPVN